MKVTVIVEDQVIIVDGDPEWFAFTLSDPDIRVIQWEDTAGELEFFSKGNEQITDFAPYNALLGQRTAARNQRIADEAQAAADEQAARLAARTPKQKRWAEYPTLEEQLEALHEARQGDSTKLTAIDVAIAAIDAKYPL